MCVCVRMCMLSILVNLLAKNNASQLVMIQNLDFYNASTKANNNFNKVRH